MFNLESLNRLRLIYWFSLISLKKHPRLNGNPHLSCEWETSEQCVNECFFSPDFGSESRSVFSCSVTQTLIHLSCDEVTLIHSCECVFYLSAGSGPHLLLPDNLWFHLSLHAEEYTHLNRSETHSLDNLHNTIISVNDDVEEEWWCHRKCFSSLWQHISSLLSPQSSTPSQVFL